MPNLKVIETLPETAGTTWTKTTVYRKGRPQFVHIWADDIIVTRLDEPDSSQPLPQGEQQ